MFVPDVGCWIASASAIGRKETIVKQLKKNIMETDMTKEHAIDWIKRSVKKDSRLWKAIESLVPELRESEDERIRRTLVEYFGPSAQLDFIRGVPIQKIRAWLEKQKEQKLAEWSEQDIQYYDAVMDMITNARYLPCRPRDEIVEWFKSLKNRGNFPKSNSNSPSLSEEDEKTINDACCWLAEYAGFLISKNKNKVEMLWKRSEELSEKLKSLRPSWKPSEEQMKVFEIAKRWYSDNMGCNYYLESLYEQLKKLI